MNFEVQHHILRFIFELNSINPYGGENILHNQLKIIKEKAKDIIKLLLLNNNKNFPKFVKRKQFNSKIPNDVLHKIFTTSIISNIDLSNLCLVNSTFKRIACNILYKKVAICSPQQLLLFNYSLESNRRYRIHFNENWFVPVVKILYFKEIFKFKTYFNFTFSFIKSFDEIFSNLTELDFGFFSLLDLGDLKLILNFILTFKKLKLLKVKILKLIDLENKDFNQSKIIKYSDEDIFYKNLSLNFDVVDTTGNQEMKCLENFEFLTHNSNMNTKSYELKVCHIFKKCSINFKNLVNVKVSLNNLSILILNNFDSQNLKGISIINDDLTINISKFFKNEWLLKLIDKLDADNLNLFEIDFGENLFSVEDDFEERRGDIISFFELIHLKNFKNLTHLKFVNLPITFFETETENFYFTNFLKNLIFNNIKLRNLTLIECLHKNEVLEEEESYVNEKVLEILRYNFFHFLLQFYYNSLGVLHLEFKYPVTNLRLDIFKENYPDFNPSSLLINFPNLAFFYDNQYFDEKTTMHFKKKNIMMYSDL